MTLGDCSKQLKTKLSSTWLFLVRKKIFSKCFFNRVTFVIESDCPRLPIDQAVTVPLITIGEELPQIVLDLRTFSAYQWKSAVIIYDKTLGKMHI